MNKVSNYPVAGSSAFRRHGPYPRKRTRVHYGNGIRPRSRVKHVAKLFPSNYKKANGPLRLFNKIRARDKKRTYRALSRHLFRKVGRDPSRYIAGFLK